VTKQDSILQNKKDSLISVPILLTNKESIFKGHALMPKNSTPLYRVNEITYWQGIVLFIIFSIYVLIRFLEPKKIIKIFVSVFSYQEARQLFREEFKLTKRASLLLGMSSILVIASLIQYANQYFGVIINDYSSLQQYFFFVVVICLTYLIKFASNYVFGFVSNNQELGKEYIFNVFVFAQTIGIIIFPLIICMQFANYPKEWFLYPALVICGGFYGLRMFRGFIISSVEQNIGIVYIFLYLCALEILPMLVLVKFLLINF
jgi:hypothetical protein